MRPFIHLMRTFTLTLTAILALLVTPIVVAQSTQRESNSTISDSTPSTIDDEAFAGYERVIKGMKPPKATKSPDPEYPKIPSDAEPNGIVVMLVGIGKNGHVELVHVLRSSNAVFEASAVTTVRSWKFSPAKKEGKAVPVKVTVEMHFQK